MSVWAIADLHLAIGVPSKTMEVFGGSWIGYQENIQKHWQAKVGPDDLVLVAGDISWATRLEDAVADLNWIHALPGRKVMIKGNHDYWWDSISKIQKVLPPSITIIQNNSFLWKDEIAVAGTRLWDTDEYHFNAFVVKQNTALETKEEDAKEQERLFLRELARLELSLKTMSPKAKKRLVMTHYPPIGADLQSSRVSDLLEKYNIDVCVFGHLHNMRKDSLPFGAKNGVEYLLTSCDYIDFTPVRIL